MSEYGEETDNPSGADTAAADDGHQWVLIDEPRPGVRRITFNRADNVREVIAATPVQQLLLETDAPYLTPVPYRGRPNAPYYLPFIAERVAQEKELPVEELLIKARSNSLKLFFSAESDTNES